MTPSVPVVVAGDSLVDLIVHPDGRIAAAPGGGAYNTARTLGRLGVPIAWLGRLSSDRFGRDLRAHLLADGVRDTLFVATDDPTTLALAELDATGAATYRFYTDGTSAPGLTRGDALRALDPLPPALHVGTLGLVLEPMADAIEALVDALPDGPLVMLDPNCRPLVVRDPAAYRARIARVAARAHTIKASTEDLAYLAPGTDPADAARALVRGATRCVLWTDGGGPVRVIGAGWERTVPTPRVAVADTIGAGDAFGGGFLAAWLARDLPPDALADADAVTECVRSAVLVAALTCTRPGAEPPTPDELAAARAAGLGAG